MYRKQSICAAVLLYLSLFLIHIYNIETRTILLDLIIIFLLLINLVYLAKGTPRNIFVMLASLAFVFCIIEGIALARERKPPIEIRAKGLHVYRDVLGWGPAAPGAYRSTNIEAKTNRTIYDVTYTFDENLLRKTISGNGPTVAFFGDSFTLGEGVNDAETMPQAFADELDRKLRVLNFGYSAYSPQQFLRTMETSLFNKVVGPDPRLFVFMTAPWQDDRVACKATYVSDAPRYILEDGDVKFRGTCTENPRFRIVAWLSYTALFRFFVDPIIRISTSEDIKLYIATTLKAVKLAKEKFNVETIILFIPASESYLKPTGYRNEDIINRFRENNIAVLNVGQQDFANPKLTIIGDKHPTPFAHHAHAVMLKQYLLEHMPETLTAQSDR